MLYRSKRRKKRLSAVWTACYALSALLGAYSLLLGCSAIASGQVESFSRFNRGVIEFALHPAAFVVTVTLWVLGGLFMLALAVHGWRTAST